MRGQVLVCGHGGDYLFGLGDVVAVALDQPDDGGCSDHAGIGQLAASGEGLRDSGR